MELKMHNSKTGLQVSEAVFGKDFNETLVHQAVTAFLAGARAGTKAQKARSDVSGGGIKPWRQKGTGRARAGTTRSPLWRHGGVTFAARPRDFTQKLNQKMYRAAMRSIFSELARQGLLHVVDGFDVTEPKTKALAQKMKSLGIEDALIVVDQVSDNLALASRNLPHVDVTHVHGVNAYSLLRYGNVVVTADAVKKIEEWLA
jgi:large subunit ribosomal protein L4